jgi:hypothetical protein
MIEENLALPFTTRVLGVEDWAVEAFAAAVWPGGHREQGRGAGLGGSGY